jgi:hypothetical protein
MARQLTFGLQVFYCFVFSMVTFLLKVKQMLNSIEEYKEETIK